MRYQLFHEFAHRYDLHTTFDHYQHDHAFVLNLARKYPSPRLLDAACGTGTLLRKARVEGIDAAGFDASPEMIAVCDQHLGPGTAWVLRMEEFSDEGAYDVVSCLSWSLNYLPNEEVVLDVLSRFHRALRPGGSVVLQVAHAPNASSEVNEDREIGPTGLPDDILLLCRFSPAEGLPAVLTAEYVYACISARELFYEEHTLLGADAYRIAELSKSAGFDELELFDSWRGEPLRTSVMPFIVGRKGV